MRKVHFQPIKSLFLFLLFALIVASCTKKETEEVTASGPPNILFIFSDDHAFQAISAYEDRFSKLAPTPNIDRIADRGMRFDRAYVTNSICAPSRATILTGAHSHVNGLRTNGDIFDGEQITFPKLLRENGYTTALIGKWHLRSKPTGFDHWEILPGQGHYYNPDFISDTDTGAVEGYVTDLITDKSLAWLEANKADGKPFMLMLQHKAPHREWEKGPDHLELYEDVEFPEPFNLFDDYDTRGTAAKEQDMTIRETMQLDSDLKLWTEENRNKGSFNRTYGRMNEEQRAAWDAVYDPIIQEFQEKNLQGEELVRWKYQRYMRDYLATIRSVDDNVGRVLDYLEENGLDENTLIVYTSDQGFYLGEHGWFDKRFMYEESFRTPLLMQWQGKIPEGTVNKDLVSNLDFAQTFLDVAGIEAPDRMQGRSLLPLMTGDTPENWRDYLYYHYYEFPGVHSVNKHEGITGERFKLMHFYELDEWEMYDLQEDPMEMNNIYNHPEYDSIQSSLTDRFKRLKRQYGVIHPKSDY
ncbi:sulfatase family protein [Cyclobacterium jeungdonense]|uniref:Sulfatase n=1 Tax=Cyclobacterium jeungdonense TaxID=708087 RepID=A0ABT8C3R7_9BACT|nr:sulfatase [Cyclobacterium jeungdonense]MDN3686386.1 sulfatase [Cyclobacterium jeungdonense]